MKILDRHGILRTHRSSRHTCPSTGHGRLSDRVSCVLFCERFPSKGVEFNPIPFDVELAELHQRNGESITAYYKRVTTIMLRNGIRDKAPSSAGKSLTTMEAIVLDTVLRALSMKMNAYHKACAILFSSTNYTHRYILHEHLHQSGSYVSRCAQCRE